MESREWSKQKTTGILFLSENKAFQTRGPKAVCLVNSKLKIILQVQFTTRLVKAPLWTAMGAVVSELKATLEFSGLERVITTKHTDMTIIMLVVVWIC